MYLTGRWFVYSYSLVLRLFLMYGYDSFGVVCLFIVTVWFSDCLRIATVWFLVRLSIATVWFSVCLFIAIYIAYIII